MIKARIINTIFINLIHEKHMDRSLEIALISPPSVCVEDDRLEPSLGLLYVAANTRSARVGDVRIHDLTGTKDIATIRQRIESIPYADVFGINAFCTNLPFALQIIEHIRHEYPKSPIIVGGPQATGDPETASEYLGCDSVVIGEGEDAFVHALLNLSLGDKLPQFIRGIPRSDIDSYAFPARDLVDYASYSRKLNGIPVISILSSRGCVQHCIHCNSVVMGGGNHAVRYRSTQNICNELIPLREHYRAIRFNDDHFTGNPDLMGLLSRLSELDIEYRAFACIKDLTAKHAAALAHSGCVHISIGLESLDPRNLTTIGKKGQIGHECNIAHVIANGITVRASFMVGLPHDSDVSIQTYFTQAAKLGIDEFAVYPLIPYPGTLIAKHPARFGYSIINQDQSTYVQIGSGHKSSYSLRHKNFTEHDVMRWKDMAEHILESNGVQHMSISKVAS